MIYSNAMNQPMRVLARETRARLRGSPWLATLVSSLVFGGCHEILPFTAQAEEAADGSRPARDGSARRDVDRVDQGQLLDQNAADGALISDALAAEAVLPSLDAFTNDGGAFARDAATCAGDEWLRLDRTCARQNASCAQEGLPPVLDMDCDGLLGLADVEPTRCNVLRFVDHFSREDETRATWLPESSYDWRCGEIHLSRDQSVRRAVDLPLGSWGPVWVRFRVLGSGAGDRALRVTLNDAAGGQVYCETRALSGSTFWTVGVGYRLPGRGADRTAPTLAVEPGRDYLIQGWLVQETLYCGLLDVERNVLAVVGLDLVMEAAGTGLEIRTTGLDVALDAVAAY